LVLALALLALPLAGITIERAPILTPLATELVPLGTSLQSAPSSPFLPTSFMAPARLVLGPLPQQFSNRTPKAKAGFEITLALPSPIPEP